jgi:hypothetical protein
MAKRLAIANMPDSDRKDGTESMFGGILCTGINARLSCSHSFLNY